MIDRDRVLAKIATIDRCLARMGDLKALAGRVIKYFGLAE